MTVEELENRWKAADRAHERLSDAVDTACREECRAATKAIEEKYLAANGEKIGELKAKACDAKRAYELALIEKNKAESPHPIGTVLVGWGSKRRHWMSRGPIPLEPLAKGVVEIRTHDTAIPANIEHGLPGIGEVFIRLCRKDGKPGLAFDRLKYNSEYKWLPEGEKPKKEEQ